MIPSTRVSPLVAVAVACAASSAFAQIPSLEPSTRIGAAAAVAGRVLATAPGTKVGRVVGSGKPIFLNDHVTTDAAGRLQILLLDQTVFTLGPDSDMVLDEFVYDPRTNGGKLAASVVKGTFRFVSGRIAHEGGESMKVRTPSGTMGIRGTIVVGSVGPESSTLILAGPGSRNNAGEPSGAIRVANAAGSVSIDQPGYGTTIAPGRPPASPSDMGARLTQLIGVIGAPLTAGRAGGPAAAQGRSASDESGEATAAGAEGAETSVEIGQAIGEAETADEYAAFDNAKEIPDTVALWEELATIRVGQGLYSTSGKYVCTGGACSASTVGSANVNLFIDFANRTIGGNASTIQLLPAGGFAGDSASILSMPFPTAGGGTATPAVISFNQNAGPASVGGNNLSPAAKGGSFAGSSMQLLNEAGILGHEAHGLIQYTGPTGESARGGTDGFRAP